MIANEPQDDMKFIDKAENIAFGLLILMALGVVLLIISITTAA